MPCAGKCRVASFFVLDLDFSSYLGQILVRQVKYLNNIVEQDHRAIKRMTRPMLNFKSFRSAGAVLAGVELMHMIRKGQFAIDGADAMSYADLFYALAGKVCAV
jgi:transposase-like protein